VTGTTGTPLVDEVVGGLAVYHHARSGPDGSTLRVVFVHGSMDRSASFLKAARRLGDLDLVRYDRRGYGRSVGAGTSPSIDDQVDDLLAVLDGRPAAVVGHSLGGVIALAAAVRCPEVIPSVGAFEAPAPWLDWWPSGSAGGTAVATSTESGPAEAAEQFMRRMIGDERWERLPARTRRERRAEGAALIAELGSIRSAEPYHPADIAVPVLAGHGSDSKPYHQMAAQQLAELAPRGELMVIDGAGHAAQSSHPDDFATFVRRVVERVD
jgi:pimeloyl-ACP methyl ester carboxylesterase